MDTYFPKTRRPIASLSGSALKRPPPSVTPPKPAKIANTPTTPKDARLTRPLKPPPVIKRKLQLDSITTTAAATTTTSIHNNQQQEARKRPVSVRELFKSAHPHRKTAPADDNVEGRTTLTSKSREQVEIQLKPLDISTRLPQPVTPIKQPQPSTPTKYIQPSTPTKHSQPSTPTKLSQPSTPTKPPVETSGPLKGISTSLLDLIRAKEAAKASPEAEHRNKIIGIAPEIVRIVFTVFTANKKEILLYDRVVDKCYKGLKSNYTTETIRDCLSLVDKAAPEWVSVVNISKGRFMRINRDNYTIPQLLEAIRRYKKNC